MRKNISNMPIQKLPLSKKNEEWRKDCVDYFIGISDVNSFNNIPDNDELQTYYDLYNGIYNEKDLKYVTNPFNQDDGFPATAQDYNIIRSKIDLLLGEETKRPFNFVVCRTSDIASSEVQDKAKQMLMDYMIAAMTAQLSPEDNARFQEALRTGEIQTPEEIQKYISKNYKDIAEISAYHTLEYLIKKLNLPHEFNKGFKHALTGGFEVYYTGIRNGDPYSEVVNTMDFRYPAEEGIEFIDEASWCVRRMITSYSELYDDYYELLDEDQLDHLLELCGQTPTAGYGPDKGPIDDYNHIRMNRYSNMGEYMQDELVNNVILYHVCWKSFKKIGFITVVNPQTGLPEDFEVDENYKVTGDELSVEWKWIVETWEGYRAGDDATEECLYFGMKPVEYQFMDDNLNSAKLPYTGVAYSNTNSKAKSLVAVMKPLQYMYIILWYRLELAIARDKGKIPVIDVTQIPKSMGIDIDKWMHYLTALGVALINPYECFSPETKVLMANGSRIAIKDIRVGDYVMGIDGTPRKVLEIHSGTDLMYRLSVYTGSNDQIVNSKHKIYYKQKRYYNSDINKLATAEELLEEDSRVKYVKNTRYLTRVKNPGNIWNREVKIDPYLLGLWLGDGSTGKPMITTMDKEIIDYLEDWATAHDMYIHIENGSGRAFDVYLFMNCNKGRADNKPNYFVDLLKYYGVYNNKHIPEDFIFTTEENRLRLLAGLIDTDGNLSKRDNYYIFSQSENRKQLVEDVAFIARSLGFKCTTKLYNTACEKQIMNNKKLSICQNTMVLNILDGDLQIPCLLPRKQSNIRKSKGNPLESNFKVAYEGIGEYCGITIDGDHMFLLDDFTIVHNCGWEIPGREGGKAAVFNQWTSIDAGMSNTINTYIGLLAKIEQMASELSGVTPQRQGSISSNELVGNVERSVTQSAHITEPWFWLHNQVKKRVLSSLLDIAKYTWKDDKRYLHYILDEGTRTFIELSDNFSYEDFDIFVSDSTKDNNAIQMLQNLIQPAMQNGASLLDAAEILTTDNLSMIKQKLEEMELKRQQMQQQVQQQEAQNQQQIQQIQNQVKEQELMLKEAELDLEKYKIDQDNATKITVAQLNAYRYQENQDLDANGTPDVMEIGRQEIERQKAVSDAANKQFELANKARAEENKRNIEAQKINAQREAEQLKHSIEKEKIALENKKLQEAMKLQKQKDKAAMERERLKSNTALKNKVSGEK